MSWLKHPIILENSLVKLAPLENSHIEALIEIGKNEKIWEFMTINGTDKDFLLKHLKSAILRRAIGDQYPFAVIDKVTGNIIGSTMFHNIFAEHRKLEIGWTWYHPKYWRMGYNRACKLLMLTYCFETLKTIRVQFQTSVHNNRSRDAILGIGAKYEGILRHDRLRYNGEYRNTVMYSIIDDEWEEAKTLLKNR